MSNPRFYTAEKLTIGSITSLPSSAAAHASRALRLVAGDKATLFNGDGFDYICELATVTKSVVTAQIIAYSKLGNESPLNITLLQAISSGDRMDYTLQKAVELGVNAIVPINSQRSVVKLQGERADKRREHWKNVVISASEQSGRAVVPPVASALTLAQWLAGNAAKENDARITLAPSASEALRYLAKPFGDIYLLIGAEGGLSNEEIALATAHSFNAATLGKRILRTETAALAAIAAMQTLWGDF